MRATYWLPAALLLALLAPAGAAHEGFDQGALLGPGSVHVALGEHAPLLAVGVPLDLRVTSDIPGAFEARLTSPADGARSWFALQPDGATAAGTSNATSSATSAHIAQVALDAPGTWTLEVRHAAGSATFSFDVWPGAAAFVEPADDATTRGLFLQDAPATLRFTLVDAAHSPVAPPADARARVEGPDGVEEVPLRAEGAELALDATWGTPGERRVEVLAESLRMRPGSAPPVQALVLTPEEAAANGLAEDERAPGRERGVPLGAPVALLAIAGAAAAYALTRGRP